MIYKKVLILFLRARKAPRFLLYIENQNEPRTLLNYSLKKVICIKQKEKIKIFWFHLNKTFRITRNRVIPNVFYFSAVAIEKKAVLHS